MDHNNIINSPLVATTSGRYVAGSLFTLLFSLFEKPEVFHPDENPEDSVSNRDFLILISYVFEILDGFIPIC